MDWNFNRVGSNLVIKRFDEFKIDNKMKDWFEENISSHDFILEYYWYVNSTTEIAWNDYIYWQGQDKKTIKRINQLIQDIDRNHNEGIGKHWSTEGKSILMVVKKN